MLAYVVLLRSQQDEFISYFASFSVQFIRCSPDWPNTHETLVNLIFKDSNKHERLIDPDINKGPRLIVSCLGGARNFKMSDELETEFIEGLGRIAATKSMNIHLNSIVKLLMCFRCMATDDRSQQRCVKACRTDCL